MDLGAALQTYFAAEKLTGLSLAIYGAVLLGAVSFVYRTHDGGFMWAFVVVLGLVGLGAVIGGSVLAVKTPPQLEHLLGLDRQALLAIEVPRMDEVNANWPRLALTWTVLIVGSLALIWFGQRDWTTGLGLALLVAASSAMVLDIFAERRAAVYYAALVGIVTSPEHVGAAQP